MNLYLSVSNATFIKIQPSLYDFMIKEDILFVSTQISCTDLYFLFHWILSILPLSDLQRFTETVVTKSVGLETTELCPMSYLNMSKVSPNQVSRHFEMQWGNLCSVQEDATIKLFFIAVSRRKGIFIPIVPMQ